MDKLLRFEVRLDNSKEVYRCGQTVAGWVQVECRSPIHSPAYYIECLGLSEVQQRQQQQQQQQRSVRQQHLSLKENLLSWQKLVESRSFEFQLPRWLPHSLEFPGAGCVRYCCRATVLFSERPDDAIHATSFFTVVEEVDLNSPLVARHCSFEQTSNSALEKVLYKLLKGEVKMSLLLNKDAYVPGEDVHCTVSVHNSSSLPVQRVELRLRQSASASGLGCRERTLVRQQLPSEAQTVERYWCARQRLHIPGVVPSSLENFHFRHPLAVGYSVEMAVVLGISQLQLREVSIGCFVIVGTVPRIQSPTASQLTSHEASFVEVSRCCIPVSELGACASPVVAPAPGSRRPRYVGPQLEYTLYCVYYPTISLYRNTSLKPILKSKRHSSDDCLEGGVGEASNRRLRRQRTAPSCSLYETPV